jgi:hypothetical protein
VPERFSDSDGGFFDTAIDGESLIKRPKSPADNPLPSGNGLAAEALMILSSYTGDAGQREAALDAVQSVGVLMDRYPSMVGHHLSVLHSSLNARELAVVGPEWQEKARVYWERFRPNVVLAPSPDGSGPVPLLAGRAGSGQTLAYLCQGHVCDLPTSDPAQLRHQLSRPRGGAPDPEN